MSARTLGEKKAHTPATIANQSLWCVSCRLCFFKIQRAQNTGAGDEGARYGQTFAITLYGAAAVLDDDAPEAQALRAKHLARNPGGSGATAATKHGGSIKRVEQQNKTACARSFKNKNNHLDLRLFGYFCGSF